jgi:flavin reductase (DIM6/NTAB) family NADH-FMN oxidoreductase RutF
VLRDVATGDPASGRQGVVGDDLRRFFRRQVANVTVVTTTAGNGAAVGFTATSFTSVSLCPPLVSFCLDRDATCSSAFTAAEYVGVHLLGTDQLEVARTFATRGVDRFAHPLSWHLGPYGVPLIDTFAWMICRIAERIVAGDHTISIAEPLEARHSEGAPLLYHDGRYTYLT